MANKSIADFKRVLKDKHKRVRAIDKRVSFLEKLNCTLTEQKMINKNFKEIEALYEEKDGIQGFLKDAEIKIKNWFKS